MTRNPRTGLAWYEKRNAGLALVLLFLAASVALLIVIAGANPLLALQGLLAGAFGDRYAVAETLVQSVPIAIVALGVAPALRAGIFPVGRRVTTFAASLSLRVLILREPRRWHRATAWVRRNRGFAVIRSSGPPLPTLRVL